MKIDCSGALTIVLCLWVIFGISKSVLLPSLTTVTKAALTVEMNADVDASSSSDDVATEQNKRALPWFRFVGSEISPSASMFEIERTADGSRLSFAEVLDALAAFTSPDALPVMEPLLQLMRQQATTRRAFLFECAPVSAETLARTPFRFAIVTSDALQRIAEDRATFAEHFAQPGVADLRVVAFENLSGDATLVVPTPADGGNANYAHLASFSLSAPHETQATLWQRTAAEMLERARQRGSRPVWLSTHGLGVSFLHVRICDKPKYYTQKALTAFHPPHEEPP